MNCWDYYKCPVGYREFCLAYPDYGKVCWKATLISCKTGKVLNSSDKKKECADCDFYRMMTKLTVKYR